MARKDKPEGVAAEVELAPALPERRSPEDWCRALARGESLYLLGAKRVWTPCWQHKAAAVLHGWGKHEHHEGRPIQLTRAEYEDALRAAEPAAGYPVAIQAATSPHINRM